MPNHSDNYDIVWLIRRLFRALAQKSDEMLQERGISAADRAVLEFLYPDNALSVPEIARKYQVSRQHVQVTVNALIDKRLVESVSNPRHRRSALMQLTKHGHDLFAAVLEEDKRAVAALFANVSARDTAVTRQTLRTLLATLDEEAQR